MHPVLFKIGSLPVNSYGVMLAISFLLGLKLASKRASRIGIRPNQISDLSFVVMVAAIVGSRLFYIFTHIEEFRSSWLDAIAFWKGLYGLSMLGGVVLAIICGFAFIHHKKWPLWKLADVSIPSFALGIFITRIGCFFNGCCFGSPTCSSLGVSFPAGSQPYSVYGDIPIHPSQLYSSAAGLFILLIILWADRRKHFPGFTFALFLGLYGSLRFGIEMFRHFDQDPIALFGYSVISDSYGITNNQLISLLMVAAALILGFWLNHRSLKES